MLFFVIVLYLETYDQETQEWERSININIIHSINTTAKGNIDRWHIRDHLLINSNRIVFFCCVTFTLAPPSSTATNITTAYNNTSLNIYRPSSSYLITFVTFKSWIVTNQGHNNKTPSELEDTGFIPTVCLSWLLWAFFFSMK